ncbi:uncharacterized protein FOMMEDRAFT_150995 [Fomitiporia mediterranea MF3/22]|uniref:uncharacterized protein n=1 Tax=Fomitiporia mediterranea (strain MF3/22) TaxID=694068 RepID=UPI0004409C07|nr:uncharacterized protein FOMMEDRAFT_150995 [Fomitiporia mediterranea MF3/22]EJD08257.1 hypothetical protein FOMMEDRAFT_150995 [Fomitiporia mediterranea MF3/22]
MAKSRAASPPTRNARMFNNVVLRMFLAFVIVVWIPTISASEHVYVAREGSLTVPTVTLTSNSASGSGSGSSTGTSSNASATPVATTTTELTTSSGPGGTSAFLTTVTTLIIPGSTSTNISSTSTSTAFPSLSTYSPCVVNCLQSGVGAPNCSSITDTACYCVSAAFTSTLVGCVTNQCPDELTTAEHLAQLFCNVASPSVSLAFPAPTTSGTINTSSTTTTSATTSQTGNAAMRLGVWEFSSTLGLGLGLSIVGFIFGSVSCW